MSSSLPPNVFRRGRDFFVNSSDPTPVFGERVIPDNGNFSRYLDPKRSKLAAAVVKGSRQLPFRSESRVLYLGAASGTTVSYVSDICNRGSVYALEISVDPFYKLLGLSERRRNIIPIIDDANNPERYSFFVDTVDIIYQDIAQRNQVQIFNTNATAFPEAKYGVLVIKTRSISSRASEASLLKESISRIGGFKINETIDLKPFDQSNYMLVMERSK